MADDLKRVGLVFKEDGAVDFRKSLQDINLELNKNYNEFKLVQSQWDDSTSKTQKLREEMEYLTNAYEIQEDKVKTLKMQLSDLENAENKDTTAIKKKRNELVNAELQLKNYENKLKTTTTNLENVEKGIKTTSEKIEELTSKIKENESQFKLVQSQYTATTTKAQKLKDEHEYLTNAYELQTEKIKLLDDQLKELQNVEDKNTSAIAEKKDEIIKAKTELNNYNAKLQEVTYQLKITGEDITKFGENISKVGEKIENVGKKTSAFSTATAGAFVASAKTAIDFEEAFTGVEKTVNATDEQLEEMKGQIRELAKEMPASTTEIAAVAEAAGQLGIKTENIMSFSKAMLDLGNSTNLTSDEAASSLAKFANVTQMSQENFDRLGATIVDLGNNFATTEADIVAMAMRLAGAGKQVGMSEAEIMGFATALSSVGIEAEMGGSALSKAMVKMQNAVETGGGKLNTILKKTGKSLEDLELMSANNSKDFKELAQSIGITSTELKQFITAGTNLEDFAKVSGMSVEQFKKAWKEDATGALSVFIKGLGDAESKGDSAIAMLTEMGLTEVRLRDSLLRAANAGNLFNDAIETGRKAWEDNTALTNEANKRYDTLKSKLAIATNKIKDMGITLGNKLMPYLERAVNWVDKLVKKFDGLNDEQVAMILKAGAVVVALGPVITILGKLTTGIGTAVKAIGTIKTALEVAKGATTSTSTAVNTLAGIFSGLNVPMGLIITLTGAYTTALLNLTTKENEASEEIKNVRNSLDEQKSSWENLQEAREDYISKNSSEIVQIQNLRDELSKITDENGNIKKGYEERANYIIGKLQEAANIEITMNEGVIQSYQEVQKAVDDTLNKKQAELLLSAYQEEYTTALQNRSVAVQNLATLQEQLTGELKRQKEIEDKLNNQKIPSANLLESYAKISDEINELNNNIVDANEQVSQYGYTISNYSELQAVTVNGNAEQIRVALEKINTSYQKATESAEESYSQQVNSAGSYIATLKTLLQEAKAAEDTYRQQEIQNELDTQRTKLKNLEESLRNEVYTIGTIGEEQIQAFQYIADNDRKGYMEMLNKLDPDTQELLQNITNSVSSNMQIPEEFKNKGQEGSQSYKNEIENIQTDTDITLKETAGTINTYNGIEIAFTKEAEGDTKAFGENLQISQKMQEEIDTTANALNSDTSIKAGGEREAEEVNIGFNRNVDGHKWGSDLVENLVGGLTGSSALGKLAGAASRVAGTIASYIHHSVPDEGPLADELEYMPDMIDNLVKTLYKASPKLDKATSNVARMASDNLSDIDTHLDIGNSNNARKINYENIIDYNKLSAALTNSILASTSGQSINEKLQKLIDILQNYFPQLVQLMNQPIIADDGTIIAHYAPLLDDELGRINTRQERGS